MNTSARDATLFQAAVQLGADERTAFLDRECAHDPVLRERLAALLAAHDQPDTVLGTEGGAARPTISLDLARDLADDLVGQTIGRYKLLEKIGEGGCGVVYVAEQTEPVRRRVALKIIKLWRAETESTTAASNEACLVAGFMGDGRRLVGFEEAQLTVWDPIRDQRVSFAIPPRRVPLAQGIWGRPAAVKPDAPLAVLGNWDGVVEAGISPTACKSSLGPPTRAMSPT